MSTDKLPGIPSKELLWIEYNWKDHKYIVTSNPERTQYFLYKLIDGKYMKIDKNKEPTPFEKTIADDCKKLKT